MPVGATTCLRQRGYALCDLRALATGRWHSASHTCTDHDIGPTYADNFERLGAGYRTGVLLFEACARMRRSPAIGGADRCGRARDSHASLDMSRARGRLRLAPNSAHCGFGARGGMGRGRASGSVFLTCCCGRPSDTPMQHLALDPCVCLLGHAHGQSSSGMKARACGRAIPEFLPIFGRPGRIDVELVVGSRFVPSMPTPLGWYSAYPSTRRSVCNMSA